MDRRGLLLKGASYSSAMCHSFLTNYKSSNSYFGFPNWITINYSKYRCCSQITTRSSLQPPDLPRLAETARISLTPTEAEEFAPKFQQMIDWFGQLQGVDLQSIEPSIRADTEDNNLREDVPETFDHRDTMIAAVPSYEEPYIKVPKVLNRE